jgi:hypothetical protein
MNSATASKSPAAQVARACCFIAAMSVMVRMFQILAIRYNGIRHSGTTAQ